MERLFTWMAVVRVVGVALTIVWMLATGTMQAGNGPTMAGGRIPPVATCSKGNG